MAEQRRGATRAQVLAGAVAIVVLAALVLIVFGRSPAGERALDGRPVPTPRPQAMGAEDQAFVQTLGSDRLSASEDRPTGIDVAPGLALAHGGQNSPLTVLHLETGELELTGIRAEPLVQSGANLVLASADHRTIGWLPIDALTEMPQGWTTSRAAHADRDGEIWLFRFDDAEWARFELDSARIVERRPARGMVMHSVPPWEPMSLVPGPHVIGTTDGIFEWTGQAYDRVAAGRVLASSESAVLIERCSNPADECVTSWFDRTTWRQLRLPTPTDPAWTHELAGDDRWLVSTDPRRTGTELVELATGRRLIFDAAVGSVDVSPDGSLLALVYREQVVLMDLADPAGAQRLAGLEPVDRGRLRFVEMTSG
ncbi:MAG: hypothetical protein AAF567_02540 [Actinomycetota bacterium]